MAPLLLFGAAVGGVAMYFFDPDKGRRRRALVRDRAVKVSTDARHFVEQGTRDLKNRGSAATGRVRSILKRHDASDQVLAERVRSKMGRYVGHPGAVEVSASGGRVTLSGSVLAHEHRELIEAVSQVPGVSDIYDQLSIFESAQGISELQGSPRARRGERAEVMQENWAPGTRLATGAAGATLTLYGLARSHGFTGFAALVAGSAILMRAATNKPLRSIAGTHSERGIDIQKTIHIKAPVEEVFQFLSNYDNFPQFMRNVLHVETKADGRSHWKVRGPAGTTVEWDAISTRVEQNELIEWSTVEGSPVTHSGSLRVEPFGDGSRVHVRMTYNPPAGAVGHVVAKLLGSDPKTELDEDMMRLKSTLETGKAPRDAAASRQGEGVVMS